MKRLALAILLLLAVNAFAQNFEGSIKWTIKTEITDPELKAQMEANKAKMNDPATQARMKQEMEARMNDPQMKKMMESNPQMKAQMEQVMKMQQMGGRPMFPTAMIMKFKNGNTLSITEGGMMPSEMLYQKDKNQTFMINREQKTYSNVPQPPQQMAGPTPTSKPTDAKVTKTTETTKILDYVCTKYVVEVTSAGKTMTQYFWTTTQIKDFDLKALNNQRLERGQKMFYEGIEGVPLRIEMSAPEMKAKMTMEVTEFKKETQKAEDFIIPADFKNVPVGPGPGMMR